ncbi:hypothetical protein [Georgenia sp. SUBG003]|uniref:hypothetical protein n=1 Tax=Georgenia sp. SUBG003 TaxID=1497974 RepID=UPI003AB5037E
MMLPLVRPAVATVVVFRFVPIWNDFFYPLILVRDRTRYTLPLIHPPAADEPVGGRRGGSGSGHRDQRRAHQYGRRRGQHPP